MRPGVKDDRRFSAMTADGRIAVTITGGRWGGRVGAFVEHDGNMCVVDLADEDGDGYAAQVRVHSRHVFKVLT